MNLFEDIVHLRGKVIALFNRVHLNLITIRPLYPLQGVNTYVIVLLLTLLNQNRYDVVVYVILFSLLFKCFKIIMILFLFLIHKYTPVLLK